MLINSLTDTLCKHLTQRDPKYIFYIKRLFKSLQHSKEISNVYYEYLPNTTLNFCILSQILNIIIFEYLDFVESIS